MQKIMFNDRFLLTQAVLDGRKTQTRRLEKGLELLSDANHVFDGEKITLYFEASYVPVIIKPRYKEGEVVAVAQRYSECGSANFDEWERNSDWFEKGFSNKMFVKAELMPHQIRIINVRVQKLQDITDEECMLEGIREVEVSNNWGNSATHTEYIITYYNAKCLVKQLRARTPRETYALLIDKISGKGTWDSNPYVFVYHFELVRQVREK